MKIISAFTAIYCLLCATRVDGVEISVEGVEGGHVSFRCSHKFAQNNSKYFCKYPCKTSEHTLAKVKMGEKMESGWIALHDTGDGAFTVTLSHLKISDAGTYCCAVDRFGFDTYTQVYLTVREGSSHETTTNIQATNTEATTNTVKTTPSWTPGYEILTNHSTTETIFHTNTNGSQGLKADQQSTKSIVIYSMVGVLTLFTASVLVLISLRKCKRKSTPQVQVCSNFLHLITADQNKANGPNINVANGKSSKQEAADQNQCLYENISYNKNVAKMKHSGTTRIDHFPSYIKPLPALPGQDCTDKDTSSPGVETRSNSFCNEATEQPRWFGLVDPQTF